MELFSMAVQAAVHRMGLELVAEDGLKRALLWSPFHRAFNSGLRYYLIYPDAGESPAHLALFRRWVTHQARI